jgi:hydrogen peroxide-dependent heme synthase
MTTIAHPPETLEGWYLSHHVLSADRAALRALGPDRKATLLADAAAMLESIAPSAPDGGWSAAFALAGSAGQLMVIHARPTIDAIADAERALAGAALFDSLRREYGFLSVTEAGLYHITAQLAKEAVARGGTVGDDAYRAALTERAAAERVTAHIQRRLYPPLPAEMPYVCFYPMSKRRDPGANWYQLTLEERSRLMYAHGLTGRRYAGRIQQTISGAIGLDDWEWGVTLVAKDPLDFKRIVTDMRFDEVSAVYATFGRFFVGKRSSIAAAIG